MLAHKKAKGGATVHGNAAGGRTVQGVSVATPVIGTAAVSVLAAKPGAIAERIGGIQTPANVKPAVPIAYRQPAKVEKGQSKPQATEVSRAKPAVRDLGARTTAVIAKPSARDDKGRFISNTTNTTTTNLTSIKVCDDKGKFVAGKTNDGKAAGAKDEGKDEDEGKDGTKKLNDARTLGLLGGIKDAVTGMVIHGNEDMDPSIKAAQEATDLAKSAVGGIKSIAKPVLGMFGIGKKKDTADKSIPWYKKMWRTMTGTQRDESTFHKTEIKLLTAIAGKSAGGMAFAPGGIPRGTPEGGEEGGGFWSTILPSVLGAVGGGSLLAKFLPKSLLPKFLKGKVPALVEGAESVAETGAKGAGLFSRMGGASMGLLKGAGGLTKGLAKRLPLIGNLLTLAGAGADVYDSESDTTTTRQEKDKKTSTAVGGGAGAIAGMYVGAKAGALTGALIGPWGAAIGGVVGGIAGAYFGEDAGKVLGDYLSPWVDDLRKADIPGMISTAWTSVTDGIKTAWDATTKTVSDFFNPIKDKLVEKAKPVVDAVKDTGNEMDLAAKTSYAQATGTGVTLDAGEANAARREFSAADPRRVDGGQEQGWATTAAQVIGGVAGGTAGVVAQGAKNSYVGKGVRAIKGVIEARANKSALVTQMQDAGITDPSEQAMFLAQMDHESGGFKSLQESFNYSSPDRLMAVSKSAAKLGKPAVEKAMTQGPQAVAEAMYGGRMGNVNPGDAYAFRGRGFTQLTGRNNYTAAGKDLGIDLVGNPDLAADPAVAAKLATWYWQKNNMGVSARAGDLQANTKTLNGGQLGYADRSAKRDKYLAEISQGNLLEASGTASPFALASPVSVSAPSLPKIPSLADIPKVEIPSMPVIADRIEVGSNRTERPNVVVVGGVNPVSRDLSDRKIAHVVTGGISG